MTIPTKRAVKSEINILLNRLEILQNQVVEYEDLKDKIAFRKEELDNIADIISETTNHLWETLQEVEIAEWKKDILLEEYEIIESDILINTKKNTQINDDSNRLINAKVWLANSIDLLQEKEEWINNKYIQKEQELEDKYKVLQKEEEWKLRQIETQAFNYEKQLKKTLSKIEETQELCKESEKNFEVQNNKLSLVLVDKQEIEAQIKTQIEKQEKEQKRINCYLKEWAELVRKNRRVEALIIEWEEKLKELTL